MRRTLAAALLTLLAGACASRDLPPGARAAPPGEVTPAFQAMRSVLIEALEHRHREDERALRGMGQEVARTGLALLESTLPHDVRRADVPRFLEGRAVFGRALESWLRAAEGGEREALYASLEDLVDAYWGWVDAYKGLPPERAV